MIDQEAKWNDALRRWKVEIERIERMLARPNFSLATHYARRLIENKQHLEQQVAEIERVREAQRMLRDKRTAPYVSSRSGSSERTTTCHPTTWEEVEIIFVSDNRIQIKVSTLLETLNYAEFGFQDRRTKNPNAAWLQLRSLAESNGTIPFTKNAFDWPKVEKRIQEIRRVFRKYFSLSDDPLPLVKAVGYKARFRVSCGPSYQT